MKTIPLKIQKVIVFIPLINPLILPIWIYNFIRIQESFSVLMKSLLIILGVMLPCAAVMFGIQAIFSPESIITEIVNCFMLYVTPLLMGLALIRYQDDYIL